MVRIKYCTGAALVHDQVFKLYPSIPERERPWRILWYQTRPYWAYYYTGRYQDVINLATTTRNAMSEPVLEESYYWRAPIKVQLTSLLILPLYWFQKLSANALQTPSRAPHLPGWATQSQDGPVAHSTDIYFALRLNLHWSIEIGSELDMFPLARSRRVPSLLRVLSFR